MSRKKWIIFISLFIFIFASGFMINYLMQHKTETAQTEKNSGSSKKTKISNSLYRGYHVRLGPQADISAKWGGLSF